MVSVRGRRGAGARCRARPAARCPDPSAPLPGRSRTPDPGRAGALRAHGPPPPRGAADDRHPGELERSPADPLLHRRAGREHRGRAVPRALLPAPGARGGPHGGGRRPPGRADHPVPPAGGRRGAQPRGRRTGGGDRGAARRGAGAGRSRPVRRRAGRSPDDGREDRVAVHVEGQRRFRARHRGPRAAAERPRLPRPPRPAPARVGLAVAAVRHQRPRPGRSHLAGPVHRRPNRALPRPADAVPARRRPRRRGAGAGAARRGLPGPRVLGRAVPDARAVGALTQPREGAARVPVPATAGRASGGRGDRLPRGDVPLAVRQRRPGGEPAAAPQPPARGTGCRT